MNFFKTNFDKTVEKLLVNFLSKIRYGKLTVQFPTDEERVFVGKEEDISASIKIYNYMVLSNSQVSIIFIIIHVLRNYLHIPSKCDGEI